MKKIFLSVLLVFAMLLACVSPALANDTEQPSAEAQILAYVAQKLTDEHSAVGHAANGVIEETDEITNAIDKIEAWADDYASAYAAENSLTYEAGSIQAQITNGYVSATRVDAETHDFKFVETNNTTNNATGNVGAKDVVLTYGDETQTVSRIYFRVYAAKRTTLQMAEVEAAKVTFDSIRGENTAENNVTENMTLPLFASVWRKGVTISWNSDNAAIALDKTSATDSTNAKATATVLRPRYGEPDANVNLTYKIAYTKNTYYEDAEEGSKENVFALTVPAWPQLYDATFTVQPANATLTVHDTYYDEDVVPESSAEGVSVYKLHDGEYEYAVELENHLTKRGKITVQGGNVTETITLAESAASDVYLSDAVFTVPADDSVNWVTKPGIFSSTEEEIRATVGGAQTNVKIKPTAKEAGATITYTYHKNASHATAGTLTEATVKSGVASAACYLKPGENIITVTVTAPEGSTTPARSYKFIVTREQPYPLSGITLTKKAGALNTRTNEGAWTPSVTANSIETVYRTAVNDSVSSITLKATRMTGSTAAITIYNAAGETLKEGTAANVTTGTLSLETGDNVFTVKAVEGETTHTYNLIVRRKQQLLTGVSVNGTPSPTFEANTFTDSLNFPYSADSVALNFTTVEGATITISGMEGTFTGGQDITLPVGSAETAMPIVTVSKTFGEGEAAVTEELTYVIGLHRNASENEMSVEAYLPAPGQFVNQDIYKNPYVTTAGPQSRIITLGSFGGNVIYKLATPVYNDAKNPYGIDFIVYGNAFTDYDGVTTSAGSAEPAAVMVSADGTNWYELAGSVYYDAATKHAHSVTYTNPDTTFAGAQDVPWTDNTGGSGYVYKNESHAQAYYPIPDNYPNFNETYNPAYTANSVSFSGTRIQTKSNAFGYADSHAQTQLSANAQNPYVEKHLTQLNGDGMDIAWAVDVQGNPVSLESISYIKLYNPLLKDGGTAGEASPEINGILVAEPAESELGTTNALMEVKVNGQAVDLSGATHANGAYTVNVSAEGASSIVVNATGDADNIYINSQRVASGTDSAAILLGDIPKIRIIAQDENKAPILYILNITGVQSAASSTEVSSVVLTPGDRAITANEEGVYVTSVASGIASFTLKISPLNDKATVRFGEQTLASGEESATVSLATGENTFTFTVVAEDGQTQQEYTLRITRESNGGISTPSNTISVSLVLLGDTAHGEGGTHQQQTWIAKRTYQVPKGSTAKYLTDMVFLNNDIDHVTDGIYISEITSPINGDVLAEYTNGPQSGWMFRVNGIIGTEGYAEDVLENGDSIIWFYSDDFLTEEGYDDYGTNWYPSGGSSSNKKADEEKTEDKTEDKTDATTEQETPTEPTPAKTYADTADHWAKDSIDYVTEKGYMQGTDADTFSPDANATRAMLAVVLHRMAGTPESTDSADFTDVEADTWYTAAIAWAAEEGIVGGYGAGVFGMEDAITREQLAVLLHRYAGKLGMDTAGAESLGFADAASVSDWAQEAILWAVKNGILQGRGENNLAPGTNVTRAEIATILERFDGLMAIEN